jgi:hypothetical protein
MFVGLVLTSAGFAVPAIWAVRRRFWGTAVSCGTLTVTSLAYHGTVHPVAQAVDMAIAHLMGVVWAAEGGRRLFVHRRKSDATVVALTACSIATYLTKSRTSVHPNSKWWHMAFHLLSQGAWCIHLFAA